MKKDIKTLSKLEKEIKSHLRGAHTTLPVAILDTGGLIDITASSRAFELKNRGRKANLIYTNPTGFLKHISGLAPLIVTPKTYQEIQKHGQTMLNGYLPEIESDSVNYALNLMTDSVAFMNGVESAVPMDQARYDAHWASIECCKDNFKKHSERCSDVDKEILASAAYLSEGKSRGAFGKQIGPVLTVSSDEHVLKGSKFLNTSFDGRYVGIIPVSTRSIR
jgi:hypothetical protein